jgi:hypothetical protein
MDQFHSKIQKVFELADRLVLVTDFVGEVPDFCHGSLIELHTPEGKVVKTPSWLELASPYDEKRPFVFAIDAKFRKTDVPIGTKVVLSNSSSIRPVKRVHKIV